MTFTVLKIHQGSSMQGRSRKWVLTVTHAAPNPVIFYAAISNFLVLSLRAEKGTIFGSYQLGRVK